MENRMKKIFISGLFFFVAVLSYGTVPPPAPLKSAAPDGIGSLALPYLRNVVIGAARVYDSPEPDLFVTGAGRTTGLYLFRWVRNSEKGIPVFDEPVRIESPYTLQGTVLQTPDHVIHGLWLDKGKIVHTVFDREALTFSVREHVSLPDLPASPQSIAAFVNDDSSVDIMLEVKGYSVPPKYGKQNPSSVEWRPYDEAGVSTLGYHFTYLYGIRYPQLLSGAPLWVRQATFTQKEVYAGMTNLTPVKWVSGATGLITGGRLGEFSYYGRSEKNEGKLSARGYVIGTDGNILRHPSVSASVCFYPGSRGPALVAGGEGAVYFYRFTGKSGHRGDPVFETPEPVLQRQADLYAGTLPVPSVADWDGDGAMDLIVGNSEGFVLFFKNTGSNDNPCFLPGERIQAGGHDIHIQAGYSGSVQGAQESRWGYLSPTVTDWTGNGLPDIIMGDITGCYSVYINRGTPTQPALEAPRPLFCNGLELHGMWRSRAAVGQFGGRTALAVIDDNDLFHLYWKLDDYHLEDAGELLLADGKTILTSADPAGGTGRCKLDFFDYDGDGRPDLIIGTGRRSSIPDSIAGYPLPVLGKKTMGTPLFMKNCGTGDRPVFERPHPFAHPAVGLVQPGGSHESGAVGTTIGGGNRRNLLVGNEAGRLYLLRGDLLELMTTDEAAKYRNKPNPLPDYPRK